jgi:photosystem II stability/assembly factor-like uncharacterized protein
MKTLIISLSLLMTSIFAYSQWEWQNPKPQGQNLRSVYFVDANNGYAAGEAGTILKSVDGGLTWDIIMIDPPLLITCIYFTDISTGYIGGGTFDGTSWTGHLLKSTDGALTWNEVNINPCGTINAMQFTSATTAYIGCAYGTGNIQKTTDGGATWINQNISSPYGITSLCFLNENDGFILANLYVYKTTNGGNSWELVNTIIPVNILYSMWFTDINTGYISGYDNSSPDGILYKTTDGGVTWTWAFIEWEPLLCVTFTNATTGYMGSRGRIYKTTDAGQTWGTTWFTFPKDIYLIRFINTNVGFGVGQSGFICKTTNAGLTWTEISESVSYGPINSIFFINNTGYAMGESMPTLKTTDGGETWTQAATISDWIPSIFFTDENTGYAASQYHVYKTVNGATSWQVSSVDGNFRSCYFLDDNHGFVAGLNGKIFKTSDAGSNWSDISLVANYDLYAVYFTDALTGYVAGNNNEWPNLGKILKTLDGGNSWNELPYNYVPALYSLIFTNSTIGYAAGVGGMISKTTDGGATWDSLVGPGAGLIFSLSFKDTNTGYATGEGFVLKTVDAGLSWHEIPNTPPGIYHSVFATENGCYIGGYEGWILKNHSLQAAFIAEPTEACVGETVTYFDQSGWATSWQWTFEGGNPATSTEQNPLVTYAASGSYNVTLTVSDGIETSSVTLENYIDISDIPGIPGTPAGETEVCINYTPQTIYSTLGGENAEIYIWEIIPAELGTIEGTGLTATVTWSGLEGTAQIRVRGYNEVCGEGDFSSYLEVSCIICEGESEIQSDEAVLIYPNPVTDKLKVCFSKSASKAQVSIINLLDEIVFENEAKPATDPILSIDVKNYPAGIYLIRIKNETGEIIRKLIVH